MAVKIKQKRFDVRTQKQFKKDIKEAHQAELEIAIRMSIDIYNKTNKWPVIEPLGTDFTGSFVKDLKGVSITPDFKIDGFKYEITKSKNVCKSVFHEKQDKVQKAIDEMGIIVFVNGFEQLDEPQYCCLGYDELKLLNEKSINKYKGTTMQMVGGNRFINRAVYRYDISWIKDYCKPLPILDLTKIPQEYKNLMEKCDL